MIPALYRDDEILVLDKPAGLASQPGAGVRFSLVEAVERDYGFRPVPVHRLDKETAGCIIVARSARAAAHWTALVESRELRKTYRAVVAGSTHEDRGVFDEALPSRTGSKTARTTWRLLSSFGSEGAASGLAARPSGGPTEDERRLVFSYLELELDTGRTHQIRLHLAGSGLPILGDDRHGDFALNKRLKKETGLKRLLLLAYSLRLPGGPVLHASIPPHFLEFLARYPDAPAAEMP